MVVVVVMDGSGSGEQKPQQEPPYLTVNTAKSVTPLYGAEQRSKEQKRDQTSAQATFSTS